MIDSAMEIGHGMVTVVLTGKITARAHVLPVFVLTLSSCVCGAVFHVLGRSVSLGGDDYNILKWDPDSRHLRVEMKLTASEVPGGI